MPCIHYTDEGRRRTDGRLARIMLVGLFVFCITGFLLSTVFIYKRLDTRITQLEARLAVASATALPTPTDRVKRFAMKSGKEHFLSDGVLASNLKEKDLTEMSARNWDTEKSGD